MSDTNGLRLLATVQLLQHGHDLSLANVDMPAILSACKSLNLFLKLHELPF